MICVLFGLFIQENHFTVLSFATSSTWLTKKIQIGPDQFNIIITALLGLEIILAELLKVSDCGKIKCHIDCSQAIQKIHWF